MALIEFHQEELFRQHIEATTRTIWV